MKTIKEKLMLVKLSQDLGMPVDADLLEEVTRYKDIQRNLVESVRKNSTSDLFDLKSIHEDSVAITEPIKEEVRYETPMPEVLTPPNLIDKAVQEIEKQVAREQDSFQQPNPPAIQPNLDVVVKKLKFLEQAIAKIVVTGPGGGSHSIITLDMPTKVITSDYTLTRYDYYVGVNASVKCNVTLPTMSITNGREYVIKDESGHAQLTPIKVIGTVDNDINGFEIRINNGAVHLIYRNGWRIY